MNFPLVEKLSVFKFYPFYVNQVSSSALENFFYFLGYNLTFFPFCMTEPPTREIISIVQTISALAKTRSINVTNLAPILAGHSLNHSTATATAASAAAK